ncbi:MAG: hypothetical protein LKF30_00230 [Sphingobium sp.]|jgi:hypothetical protein|nr:hypothetical protein [Sphingobium sp.]MCI1754976.1 hypothetical protein [Sphingobium sp.]MCI2051721.1 hypothetical protein [Sphingobium sp.]
MPVHPARLRLAPLAAALVASLLLGGCGGKSAGNSTQAHLSDLEKADGTINDGMTDLDGVQTETPAVALTNAAPAASPAGNASDKQASNTAAPAQEEVVADQ